MDREDGLSLVTSTDMRSLHDKIHNTTNKLIILETLQQDFEQSEQHLMQSNSELKDELKILNRLQLIIIVVIGLIWMLVIRTAK
jgi:CHASE3 domain sensor protein